MFKAKLHAGEVEVMILAGEIGADLLILDDKAAKNTARYLNFNVTGTIGVLMRAKERGIIRRIEPALMKMIDKGFYVSDTLIDLVLKNMGEI